MATKHSTTPASSFAELIDQALQPDAAVGIKEFTRNSTFPCSAKMIKESRTRRGQEKEPEAEVDIYVHSAHKVNYVVADEMSVDHRKHIQPTSQRFYVSTDCKGWFEVLSQDGISARPFASVMELSKLATSSRCLVRQSIGGYVRKSDGYDSQIVRKGDVLTLSETLWVSMRNSGNTFNKQLLRCVDQRRQEIYLDVNQRGVFSPIAGNTNVTGAHTVQSLLTKFRLPVMVRLLYGSIHQAVGSTYSTGVFKLITMFSDEILFALPLKARPEDSILPIPTRAMSLKFKAHPKQRNDKVQNLRRQCRHLIARHLDTIISVPALYESVWLSDIELEPLVIGEKKGGTRAGPVRSMSIPGTAEEEELFREIDDIYNAIGCTPNPVPRPVVFTTGPGARNKGLKRATTAVSKVKTVPQRLSNPAHKTHIIDDNWQMLPRQMPTTTALHLRDIPDANVMATDPAHVQISPKPDRVRRKPKTEMTVTRDTSKVHGDHLYEEIPYFSQTNVDATGMEIQKTMYVSDTRISVPDMSQQVVEPESIQTKCMKIKEPPSADHILPKAVSSHPAQSSLSRKETTHESSPHLKRPSRPKSLAGVIFPAEPEESPSEMEHLFHQQPPPLPPKRGESMCNLRDELQRPETRATTDGELSKTPSPLPESTNPGQYHQTEESTLVGSAPAKPSATVERRPSSKVSSAVKTLGNVSRSVLNTFRRFGGRSSATLVISSPEETLKQSGASSSKDSVAKSSSGSSPEPQTLSDKSESGEREFSFSLKPDSDALS